MQARLPKAPGVALSSALSVLDRATMQPEMGDSQPNVVCRLIGEADLPAIAKLLAFAKPERNLSWWRSGLTRLALHSPPDGYPRFGYMLEAEGRPVGVHLLICSTQPSGVRCNASAWVVLEEFRSFATMLMLRATRQQPGVYVTLWPSQRVVSVIEALGSRRISQGVYAAVPLFARQSGDVHITAWQDARLPEADRRLLMDHTAFGCLGIWCRTRDGGEPLIIRRRWIKRRLPYAQLIYCRSLETLEAAAPAIGRMLASRGMPLLLVPADRPLRGVPGRFFPARLPVYCRGEPAPPIGDLTYNYPAIFGSDVQYSGSLSRVLAVGARSLGYQRAGARGTEDPRQHWQTGSGN
jgi:hypothetical protein